MCKPCYKFKKAELLKTMSGPFSFGGVKIAKVTEPLTRLAVAIAMEAEVAKVEKVNSTVQLSGTGIIPDPMPASEALVQDAGKLNTVKCGVVNSNFQLGVTSTPTENPAIASKVFKTGAIVRYLPATIIQVANRKRAQLADLSGWISIETDGKLNLSDYVEDTSDSEDEDEHLVDEINHDDHDHSGDAQPTQPALPDDDLEIVRNAKYDEEYFSINFSNSTGGIYNDSGSMISESSRGSLRNQSSMGFFKLGHYESISDIRQLITFADKNGNTAAHYAASLGLTLSLASLVNAGSELWKKNVFSDTPASLQYLPLNSGEDKNALFTSLHRRGLLPNEALSAALNCSFTYQPSSDFNSFIKSVKEDLNENDACYFAEDALQREVPHALLYRAAFRLLFSYGPLLAKQDLDQYLKEIVAPSDGIADRKPSFIDPLYYYCLYLLWKRPSGGRPSHSKKDRLRAYDAIRALRMFPSVYDEWMDPKETLEKEIEESGIANIIVEDVEEDDYSDILPPPGPDDPEMVWERAKTHYKLKSPSLDLLMQMIGLKDVKERAISVALTVLLSPPPDLKCQTSMNFLFVGNPGE